MQGKVSLARAASDAYASLIAETAGRAPRAMPWLAPALLFASAQGQRHLTLPRPGEDELLIHDYQSVSYRAPFPLDAALDATVESSGNDHRIALASAGTPVAELATALRLIRRGDLAAAAAAPFPARLTDSLDWSAPLTVSQDQTGRYLALSGDPNPIHRDTALAAELGLAAPVVPGLLLAALIQPAAEAATAATLSRLTVRFMAPLSVAHPFRLALQARGGTRLRACLATETRALALADLDFAA